MTDPMDQPPADHGSDRHGYIELEGPEGIAPPSWLTDDWQPCQDCPANAFLRWGDTSEQWHVTVAHDDQCPILARIEAGEEPGTICLRCGHLFNPHRMIATTGDPHDGGIGLCPVLGCQCFITWGINGMPALNVPDEATIADLRHRVQTGQMA